MVRLPANSLFQSFTKLVVRNVNCDYYQGDSSSSVQRDDLSMDLPIVRIFGSVSVNDVFYKCCLHVHGFYPYFYVLIPDEFCLNTLFLSQFENSLNFALDLLEKKRFSKVQSDTTREQGKPEVSVRKYVLECSIIQKQSLYGYDKRVRNFIKIYLRYPLLIKKAAELLQNCSIMSTVFQPFELHIPYILRFFIDCELYGMDNFYLHRYSARSWPDAEAQQQGPDLFSGTVPQTICPVELDCHYSWILESNAPSSFDYGIRNPGLNFIWQCENRRLNLLNDSHRLPIKVLETSILQSVDDSLSSIHYKQLLGTVLSQCSRQPSVVPTLRSNISLSQDPNDTFVDEDLVASLQNSPENLNETDGDLLRILEDIEGVVTEDANGDNREFEPAIADRSFQEESSDVDLFECSEDDQFVAAVSSDSDDDVLPQLDGMTAGRRLNTRVDHTPSTRNSNSRLAGQSTIVSFRQPHWYEKLPQGASYTFGSECAPKRRQVESWVKTSATPAAQTCPVDVWNMFVNPKVHATFNFQPCSYTRLSAVTSKPSVGQKADEEARKWNQKAYVIGQVGCQQRSDIDTQRESFESSQASEKSRIQGPMSSHSFAFDSTINDLRNANLGETGENFEDKLNVTICSVELVLCARGATTPDPQRDSIVSICFEFFDTNNADLCQAGCLCVREAPLPKCSSTTVETFGSEAEMINRFVELIRKYDPDMFVGWDIQRFSFGYLIERASAVLDTNFAAVLSRVPDVVGQSLFSSKDHWWSMADLNIAGRIVLNLWRIMRMEVGLKSYTIENVAYHVLHQRIPCYTFQSLYKLCVGTSKDFHAVLEYGLVRARLNVLLLNHCQLITRTAEMARLFGIQFFDVLSRGTQFRVEAMLFRLSRAQDFIGISPNVQQRRNMAAPACIPLTMEPESRFYANDPVIVLDFQSLYPSIVIAYNYCYSTCLGSVAKLVAAIESNQESDIEFGCSRLRIQFDQLRNPQNYTVSPAGIAFVTSAVHRGLLPQMLDEILATRVMVKNAMKQLTSSPSDRALYRILDARQLGLKLIANVTYGYTSANFSGRMPCVEVADSIVHKGRETLERSIDMVRRNDSWNARVVYGDTDSLFICLPGRTEQEAFEIGYEICEAVTADNPKPVKLKFEKVYMPCILQTKKRYVGYAYETPDQIEPKLDAKGIETVRRDTCDAVSKILEKSIRILFESKDISSVRSYVQRQLGRVKNGRVNIHDFIFAKEYRGADGYRSTSAAIPSVRIARQLSATDPRAVPLSGERVPYVVMHGAPDTALMDSVRQPQQVKSWERLHARYYINSHIVPALDRILNLCGESVAAWNDNAGEKRRTKTNRRGKRDRHGTSSPIAQLHTLSQIFTVSDCSICGELCSSAGEICVECMAEPMQTAVRCLSGGRKAVAALARLDSLCRKCQGFCSDIPDIECVSTDCPVYFRRKQLVDDVSKSTSVNLLDDIFS